jgi:hypothetical protein
MYRNRRIVHYRDRVKHLEYRTLPERKPEVGERPCPRSRKMCLGGVGRKGYICTLTPLNRASLARQEVGARPRFPCTCCTMARPRCSVILPPQGGRRDFRFGELHDWPTGSSRTYDPRLARGCRCNVSRLVTYSVSSAGTGSTRCVW